MSKPTYYITTPIYYVNGAPHIGTALTTTICDFEKRFRTLKGEKAWFLTGTDENATKVLEAAQAANPNPHEFVTEMSDRFRDEWSFLNIDLDDFIRTTEPRHKETVQHLFSVLRENGYVYPDKYEGWYDVGSESFVREADLVDGKSPDGNEVRWVSEENWFFKLSAFGDRLLEHIEANPEFLLPETRKNEVVSFIKSGLRDMCITRANQGWGIPVPGDESKVIYVWFDALINYLAATGWPNAGWDEKWPADIHWMAKEIFTRFHATLWPAMLMGAGVPLPNQVIAHGWFTFSGEKISKSKGGLITPKELVDLLVESANCAPDIAVDVVRFVLAAMLPYEGDRDFSVEEVERRYNTDLANDLGNALNRSLSMAQKFTSGIVPTAELDPEALEACERAKQEFEAAALAHRWDVAADRAISLVRFLNKYIDTKAPWALAKNQDPALSSVIYSMLFCLRTSEGLVRTFMPTAADAMARQLNLAPLVAWAEIGVLDSLPSGTVLNSPEPIFPRIDTKKKAAEEAKTKPTQEAPPKKEDKKPVETVAPVTEEITIEDFMKIQLRVARILEAEPLEGSDKLMKLQVMVGSERRQIVAGIRKSYSVEDLVGRQIIVVANLKPAKLRGADSQGMLLAAATDDGGSILLMPEREAPEGSKVK